MKILGTYNTLEIEIQKDLDSITIKDLFRNHLGISRRLITQAKKSNQILLNNRPSPVNKTLYRGDVVKLIMEEESHIEAENFPIELIYEDLDLLVVNKSPGVLVHPTKNHESGTLLNRILYYSTNKGEIYKPHLVNRLDRDTSGLLIVAKNPYAHYELMKQMEENKLEKRYLALAKGNFKEKSGKVEFRISDKKQDGINRLVSEDGKEAKTEYNVLKDRGNLALVDLNLITGRTHQIRVHLQEIGHPLVGDQLYGGFGMNLIGRQALHAYYLNFESPRTGRVELKIDLPADMKAVIDA